MEYAIEMKNVRKNYPGVTAVKDLSIKLSPGRIYGFIGPNGAGKTTTIKMMLGITRASQGEIFVNGIKVASGIERKLNVGYLPDVAGFYEWMRAEEYLDFCGQLLGLNKEERERESIRLLKLTGLTGLTTKIKGYSRGMKQRLGLAQALIGEPSLILLDEPASALDPLGRKEIMDLILSLKGKHTVLFSSHIIADVERVCDEILIMDRGILKFHKSIEEINEILKDEIEIAFINSEELINAFMEELEEEAFILHMENKNSNSLSLLVSDQMEAAKKLPQLIIKHGLSLSDFKIKNQGLEALFLEVTKHA